MIVNEKRRIKAFLLVSICFGHPVATFSSGVDSKNVVIISGEGLTIQNVVDVARNKFKVVFSEEAAKKVEKSRESVDNLVNQEEVVYGLTTGFGSLASVSISKEQTEQLQKNLIRSHAVGVGPALPEDIVRAAMLLRVNAFARGASGIRLKTVYKLIEMLNKEIYPYVPQKGSVGASGDLAPLSHIMLVLMGEGEVFYQGERVETKDVLDQLNFEPITLTSKEGLALNNGCNVLTAIAALTIDGAYKLIKGAHIVAAVTFEALKACSSPFDSRIHQVRPHEGQIACAANMRMLLQGSSLIDSCNGKVQDCYSIRCFPQVMGASIDAFNYAKKVIEIEMNSATDNPLIFDGKAYSGGNFHGQPIALAMDFLGIALAEIGNISERRSARLVDPTLNEGLPAFLVEGSGLNSGFMIPQYTAASLVSENKVLAHPSSVDSIPTCSNQEDHVSMGSFSARKAREILENVFSVIAIELYLATQALEFRVSGYASAAKITKDFVRTRVPFVADDCVLYKNIQILTEILKSNILVDLVEQSIGTLQV
jgi:histidine ammonia-lyase